MVGDRNLALVCTNIAVCWIRNEYSVWLIITKLEQVVMHWNAILLQLVYGLTVYRSVRSIYQTAIGIISPVEFVNEASHFQYVMGKSWPHSAASNYIYLCGWIYASCLSYISKCPSQKGQKLNWNVTQALQKIYHSHSIIYGQLVLSPF